MSDRLISWLIFVLLCFIWGSSFIMMKVSNQGLTPYQVAALRIFSAALVFIPFAVFHLSGVTRKTAALLFITGFFGNFLPAFCFAIAVLRIDSSLTGILNSLTPICVVLTGILVFRDRIKMQKIWGVLMGFVGLCLLTFLQSDVSFDNARYSFLVVLGTISYGFNVNLVGHYLKSLRPLHIATISLAFMSVPAAFVLWQQDFWLVDFSDSAVQWSLINCLLLGIVSSAIGTVLFYLLVKKAGGLFASLVTYGIPFVALFWGIIDGEKTSWIEILCLGIILSGVYLANRRERKNLR